ncbi:MAG: hypothetical protein ACI8XB_002840, partial [Patiriisocius sp.]
KQVIIETAREDSYTGDIDDEGSTSWGHGKINAYLALQSVLGLVGITEVSQDLSWSLYPNPAKEVLMIDNLNGKIDSIMILDDLGRVIKSYEKSDTYDVSNLSSGVYWFRVVLDNKVQQQKFVIN